MTVVQEFLSRLPTWTKFFDEHGLPSAVPQSAAVDELRQRLGHIRRRMRDGPDAPLRIAFFGPTGAGKSKLFGSLIRDNFSGSGFKRPFTRASFYYVHEDWKPLVPALAGEVSLHQEQDWNETILIDTPDFDSVESQNRVEAERVFLETDGFLFVTDALKYADASTWEYLTKIKAARKPFAVILNKVNSDSVSASFRERFERTFSAGKPGSSDYIQVIVPEFPIDDTTLIDDSHASMQQLRTVARGLLGDHSRGAARIDMLQNDLTAFADVAENLQANVIARRTEIQRARQSLLLRANAARTRLERRLTADLEPEVRENVYRDVMARLEQIDYLRYPRQLMSLPIRGIQKLVSGWMPGKPEVVGVSEPAFADPISSETFHLLEAELIAFADESRTDLGARPGLESILDRDMFRSLTFDHPELQQLYIDHHRRFREWVESHARDTASEITRENKAKFIISQVLFNTVLISAQVSTGGISPLELGADSVISPLVAKGISMAIGSEKVKQFETAAHVEHQRSLNQIIDLARQRFDGFLEKSGAGLDAFEETLGQIVASRAGHDAIIRHFAGERSVRESAPATSIASSSEPVMKLEGNGHGE